MIDWGSVYNASVLAACAILFCVAIYAIIHSGRLGALADVFLRLLGVLVDRAQAARATYKAGRQGSA